jgi:Leucine-rich repeat (LRR) protein
VAATESKRTRTGTGLFSFLTRRTNTTNNIAGPSGTALSPSASGVVLSGADESLRGLAVGASPRGNTPRRRPSYVTLSDATDRLPGRSELYGRSWGEIGALAKSCLTALGRTASQDSSPISFTEFKMVLAMLSVPFTEMRAFQWFRCCPDYESVLRDRVAYEGLWFVLAVVARVTPPRFVTFRDAHMYFSLEHCPAVDKEERAKEWHALMRSRTDNSGAVHSDAETTGGSSGTDTERTVSDSAAGRTDSNGGGDSDTDTRTNTDGGDTDTAALEDRFDASEARKKARRQRDRLERQKKKKDAAAAKAKAKDALRRKKGYESPDEVGKPTKKPAIPDGTPAYACVGHADIVSLHATLLSCGHDVDALILLRLFNKVTRKKPKKRLNFEQAVTEIYVKLCNTGKEMKKRKLAIQEAKTDAEKEAMVDTMSRSLRKTLLEESAAVTKELVEAVAQAKAEEAAHSAAQARKQDEAQGKNTEFLNMYAEGTGTTSPSRLGALSMTRAATLSPAAMAKALMDNTLDEATARSLRALTGSLERPSLTATEGSTGGFGSKLRRSIRGMFSRTKTEAELAEEAQRSATKAVEDALAAVAAEEAARIAAATRVKVNTTKIDIRANPAYQFTKRMRKLRRKKALEEAGKLLNQDVDTRDAAARQLYLDDKRKLAAAKAKQGGGGGARSDARWITIRRREVDRIEDAIEDAATAQVRAKKRTQKYRQKMVDYLGVATAADMDLLPSEDEAVEQEVEYVSPEDRIRAILDATAKDEEAENEDEDEEAKKTDENIAAADSEDPDGIIRRKIAEESDSEVSEADMIEQLMEQRHDLEEKQKLVEAELDLSAENHSAFPAIYWQDSKALERLARTVILDLSENKMQGLPDRSDLFAALGNCCQKIDISGNRIVRLPDGVGMLKCLQILKASQNRIDKLPVTLTRLTALKVLSLHGNSLKKLPDDIGALVNLQALHVQNNQIDVIPDSIAQLVNLRDLNFAGNCIRFVPFLISKCVNLARLDVSANALHELPPTLGNLANLQSLIASDNQLRELPANLGKCTKLQVISVPNNQIRIIPSAFKNLHNLLELNVQQNEVWNLDVTLFEGLHSLQVLKANHNQIEELPFSVGRCPFLHDLQLASNLIATIPLEIAGCKALRKLDLRGNRLGCELDQDGRPVDKKITDPKTPNIMALMDNIKGGSNGAPRDKSNNDEDDELDGDEAALVQHKKVHSRRKQVIYKGKPGGKPHRPPPRAPLPPSVATMANLEWVDVSRNGCGLATSELGYCRSLRYLNMAFNEIEVLDDVLCSSPAIEVLDVSHNHLTYISSCLALKMKRLNTLDVSYNHLHRLPDNLGFSSSLIHVYASSNILMNIPSTLGFIISRLATFDFADNSLSELPTRMPWLRENADEAGEELAEVGIPDAQLEGEASLTLVDHWKAGLRTRRGLSTPQVGLRGDAGLDADGSVEDGAGGGVGVRGSLHSTAGSEASLGSQASNQAGLLERKRQKSMASMSKRHIIRSFIDAIPAMRAIPRGMGVLDYAKQHAPSNIWEYVGWMTKLTESGERSIIARSGIVGFSALQERLDAGYQSNESDDAMDRNTHSPTRGSSAASTANESGSSPDHGAADALSGLRRRHQRTGIPVGPRASSVDSQGRPRTVGPEEVWRPDTAGIADNMRFLATTKDMGSGRPILDEDIKDRIEVSIMQRKLRHAVLKTEAESAGIYVIKPPIREVTPLAVSPNFSHSSLLDRSNPPSRSQTAQGSPSASRMHEGGWGEFNASSASAASTTVSQMVAGGMTPYTGNERVRRDSLGRPVPDSNSAEFGHGGPSSPRFPNAAPLQDGVEEHPNKLDAGNSLIESLAGSSVAEPPSPERGMIRIESRKEVNALAKTRKQKLFLAPLLAQYVDDPQVIASAVGFHHHDVYANVGIGGGTSMMLDYTATHNVSSGGSLGGGGGGGGGVRFGGATVIKGPSSAIGPGESFASSLCDSDMGYTGHTSMEATAPAPAVSKNFQPVDKIHENLFRSEGSGGPGADMGAMVTYIQPMNSHASSIPVNEASMMAKITVAASSASYNTDFGGLVSKNLPATGAGTKRRTLSRMTVAEAAETSTVIRKPYTNKDIALYAIHVLTFKNAAEAEWTDFAGEYLSGRAGVHEFVAAVAHRIEEMYRPALRDADTGNGRASPDREQNAMPAPEGMQSYDLMVPPPRMLVSRGSQRPGTSEGGLNGSRTGTPSGGSRRPGSSAAVVPTAPVTRTASTPWIDLNSSKAVAPAPGSHHPVPAGTNATSPLASAERNETSTAAPAEPNAAWTPGRGRAPMPPGPPPPRSPRPDVEVDTVAADIMQETRSAAALKQVGSTAHSDGRGLYPHGSSVINKPDVFADDVLPLVYHYYIRCFEKGIPAFFGSLPVQEQQDRENLRTAMRQFRSAMARLRSVNEAANKHDLRDMETLANKLEAAALMLANNRSRVEYRKASRRAKQAAALRVIMRRRALTQDANAAEAAKAAREADSASAAQLRAYAMARDRELSEKEAQLYFELGLNPVTMASNKYARLTMRALPHALQLGLDSSVVRNPPPRPDPQYDQFSGNVPDDWGTWEFIDPPEEKDAVDSIMEKYSSKGSLMAAVRKK